MAFLHLVDRLSLSPTLFVLVSSAVISITYILIHTFFLRRLHSNAPPEVSDNFPITGPFRWWTERWVWWSQKCDQSSTSNFSFHVGPHTIVGLSGARSRQLFFESKQLGFNDGYSVLFGQSPQLESHDDGIAKEEDLNNYFARRLAHLLKADHLRTRLPILISDARQAIDTIRNSPKSVFNPFDSLYRLVFLLTIRAVGADEIAEDPKLLEEFLKHFEAIDRSATATAIMYPKLPSPAVLKRTYAGARLYMIIEKIIKKRAESNKKYDDALQYLLDQGDRTFKVVEFIVGALFAGLLNSGINVGWVVCYLAAAPEWLLKTQEEIRNVAAKYAKDPSAPLPEQLKDIPLEGWENEFPVIDSCLRESIRMNLLGSAYRRNISGKPIPTGNCNEVIPPGAFVAYMIADVHLDPTIYPNPTTFDPARYTPERAEDKKDVHAYLGWGVARHPCAGMRFAKLEQNIITAYFIASFDFELQDQNGNKLAVPPLSDPNRHAAHKPSNPPYIKVIPKEK